ncbi:MAG: HupE/UreJ family protein [Proteobacteria bacterium]|nr:HupE/UreJ family protein [Pseudomonadota bacterium]
MALVFCRKTALCFFEFFNSIGIYTLLGRNTKQAITKVTYFGQGTEHIIKCVDHLLSVFALLLIVNSTRRLVITITAFTLAHSITLGAATLGLVYVPQHPVEVVITLSILSP